jgi:Rrf2 family protein
LHFAYECRKSGAVRLSGEIRNIDADITPRGAGHHLIWSVQEITDTQSRRVCNRSKTEPMLSLTAEYALRAVLYIADQSSAGPVRVEPMADAMGLPRNYLAKTLNLLAKRGILTSQRGPTGGFRLAISPESMTLASVIEGFGAEPTRRGCLLGRPRCNEAMPCPAHWRWKSVAEDIAAFFRETTVADLLNEPSAEGELGEVLRGRREARTARGPTVVTAGPSGDG